MGLYTRTGTEHAGGQGQEQRIVNGDAFVLETGLVADLSLVKAWRGDRRQSSTADRAQFQSDDGHGRTRDHRQWKNSWNRASRPDHVHRPVYSCSASFREPGT
jgi:hypothetical protein